MICSRGPCRLRAFEPSRKRRGTKPTSMKKLARFTLMILVSGLIAMSMMSCAPSLQELNLSQERVDHLPSDQALSFLQTLSPSPQGYIQCRFNQEGVARWLPQRGQVLPGKKPYRALDARPERPGVMIVIVLSEKGRPWCIIPAESNADRIGRGDYEQFAGKIFTALLSLGVTAKSYGGQSMRARQPSEQRQ